MMTKLTFLTKMNLNFRAKNVIKLLYFIFCFEALIFWVRTREFNPFTLLNFCLQIH